MFILSICIPTYNRSALLVKTIESIVSQKRFLESEDVQIIISDNCSDDNTRDISNLYVNKYKAKIIYHRNEENILDKNFETALSLGTGTYLKLNNDTLSHTPGSLDMMINSINNLIVEKPILYFTNGWVNSTNHIFCNDFNSFIRTVGGYVTFIGFFGIWKKHFKKIEDFSRRSDLKLPHTDCLFRVFNFTGTAFINNQYMFSSNQPVKKGGYDVLTVFVENYIFLLNEQVEVGKLSKDVFQYEKKNILINFVRPWLLNILFYPKIFSFSCKQPISKIISNYKNDKKILFYFSFRILISFCRYCLIKVVKIFLAPSAILFLRDRFFKIRNIMFFR